MERWSLLYTGGMEPSWTSSLASSVLFLPIRRAGISLRLCFLFRQNYAVADGLTAIPANDRLGEASNTAVIDTSTAGSAGEKKGRALVRAARPRSTNPRKGGIPRCGQHPSNHGGSYWGKMTGQPSEPPGQVVRVIPHAQVGIPKTCGRPFQSKPPHNSDQRRRPPRSLA